MSDKDKKMWDYYQTKFDKAFSKSSPRYEMLYKKIIKLIPSGKKIIEIGYGDGKLINKISKKYEAFAADISSDNINLLNKKNPKIVTHLIEENLPLNFKNDYFDGFIASEVLEHMNNQELELIVYEIKRILKSEGYAFLTFPAEEDLDRSICFCPKCGEVFHRVGHKQVWTKSRIEEVFREFKIISINEYYNRFVGNSLFDNILGKFMWIIQTYLNYITKFPNKIFNNRSYVVILKK